VRQTVDDLGQFTLYQCGRVHVRFSDRAILDLSDPSQTSSSSSAPLEADESRSPQVLPTPTSVCRIILPRGERVTVRAANPIGVEEYVHAATRFLRWATSTDEERAAQQMMETKVQVEMERTRRTLAINSMALAGMSMRDDLDPGPGHARANKKPGDSIVHAPAEGHQAVGTMLAGARVSEHTGNTVGNIIASAESQDEAAEAIDGAVGPNAERDSAVRAMVSRNEELIKRIQTLSTL